MNHRYPLLAVLPFAVVLAAQDTPAGATPSPKTAEHEQLAAFVGTWRVEGSMAAMPGVPGMEKPTQWLATAHAELVCGGLWLKVIEDATWRGESSHGVWLLGYDPRAKTYQCIAVSEMDTELCCIEADYDATAKTWNFHGKTSRGAMRSVFVLDGDRAEETCYGVGPDGKEVQFLHSVRTRLKDAPPPVPTEALAAAAPVAAKGAAPSPALAALLADCGIWDGEVELRMGGRPTKAKCRDVVVPVCGGHWTWSDHTGSLMGTPYEAHVLTGIDGVSGRINAIWIDSTDGAFLRTEGAFDEQQQTLTMLGTTFDPRGQQSAVAVTATHADKDTRQVRMVFGDGKRPLVLTTDYRRAAK